MMSNKLTQYLKASLFVTAFSFITASVSAQKWQPGYFIDVKGAKVTGLIRANPGGSGPIKNEGFIEFRDDEKSNPYKLSTSDLQSFVAGKDSFVVAHAPGNELWDKKDLDFVRVAVNEEVKVYATRGAGSGGGSGIHVSPGIGLSTGGGYGTSYGGGLGISFGGGGGGGKRSKMTYYYGTSTATMQHLTEENFIDIMSNVMGDEPEVVEQIRSGKYRLNSIDKLIEYFNKVKASHK